MTALSFLGAIDTVTGSRTVVDNGDVRLMVDCGLFQGPKKLRERNWRPLPIDVSSIDAVILSHAHIDHSGYLPKLCRDGYRGPVYCTPGTRDLLRLLLPDAGHLQEEEARHANQWGYASHTPALPLFTRADAEASLAQLVAVGFGAPFAPADGVIGRFARAGHIIGSATVRLELAGHTIAFTGDVGRPRDPIMRPPEPLTSGALDALVVESTYGDRLHGDSDAATALARVIVDTVERRGTVIIPSFAVGRAQHVLHMLDQLRAANRIPECPIYLDSPMAIEATELLIDHVDDHVLAPAQCRSLARIARYTQQAEDSKAIDRADGPQIVIAASGMCTGGRVLHHLRRFLPDQRSTVLFVGFQAAGTRGRSLVDGASELKLLGQYVPVRARIVQLDGLSAHADYRELLDWLARTPLSPRNVLVHHGEPAAADALRRRLKDRFSWAARVPEFGERVTL